MTPRLSVVLPAYRAAPLVGPAVRRLRDELPELDGGLEVIVVDDGSADGTTEEAWRAGADQVVTLPVNRGKGAAVRAGMLAARGEVIAFTDVDLAYAPSQLLRLLEAVESGADMVMGNRLHVDTQNLVRARRLRELTGRLFGIITAWLVLDRRVRDTQCGLKAFRRRAARALFGALETDGFAFDVEIVALALRAGLRIEEVAVKVSHSDASTVRVGRDALRMLADLVQLRLRLARRAPLTFTTDP